MGPGFSAAMLMISGPSRSSTHLAEANDEEQTMPLHEQGQIQGHIALEKPAPPQQQQHVGMVVF